MAESWSKSRKKRKKITLVLLLVSAVVVAGIFIYNNHDFFSQGSPETAHFSVEKDEPTQQLAPPAADEKPAAEIQSEVQVAKPSVKEDSPKPETERAEKYSVTIPPMRCALADRDNLVIRVSLKFLFSEESVRDDILLKREELKVITQKVLSQKTLSDIKVNEIRAELLKAANGILENGKVDDIEFLDFMPIE